MECKTIQRIETHIVREGMNAVVKNLQKYENTF